MIDALKGIAIPNLSGAEEAAATDTDEAFSELFVRTVLAEVQKAMPEGSLLGGDLEMFGDLLLDEIASRIAHADAMDLGTYTAPAPVVPVMGRVTSRFGHRHDPIHGEHRHHDGVDIAAPIGTPIEAARSGTVVHAGPRGGYGNTVVVEHADGSRALYAHCDRLDVQVGQPVRAGRPIATVGSTGRSTGPHLHLEVRVNGEAVDPVSYLGLPSEWGSR